MSEKFKIQEGWVNGLDRYDEVERVKVAVVLKILEEDGLTPEIRKKWERTVDGEKVLLFATYKRRKEVTKDGYIPTFTDKFIQIPIS